MSDPETAPGSNRLGRYELLRLLATGGMGEVFLARLAAVPGFEKLVAIKRLLPHLARDEQFVTMLLEEAGLVARLEHPNICQVYDVGNDGGTHYIVMQYLQGVSFLELLRKAGSNRTRSELGLVLAISSQVCEGLHHAHEATASDGSLIGLVHRDISLSNLMVTTSGLAKILDFGIAKTQDSASRTRTGTIRGKLHYMPPEQLRCEALDRRADIYSLAVCVFEMLTLRRAFAGANEYELQKKVLQGPRPRLNDARPDLAPALEAVLVRAMSRDRDERHATAMEFKAALLGAAATAPWDTSALSGFIDANFAEEIQAPARGGQEYDDARFHFLRYRERAHGRHRLAAPLP